MWKSFAAALSVLVISSTGTVEAQQISRQIPVDTGFTETSVGYSGAGRAYSMMIKLIVVGGKLELCGVGAYTKAQFRVNVDRGMRRSKFKVNGQTIITGLDYFSTVRRPSDMRGSTANCRASGVAAPSQIESVDIDWGDFTAR